MAERKYGENFKTLSVGMTPAQHKRIKVWAAQYEIPAGEVARLALLDESSWRKAVKLRAKERAAK